MFCYILAVYVIVSIMLLFSSFLESRKEKYYWDCFTRVVSSVNAIVCTTVSLFYFVFYYDNVFNIDWKGTPTIINTLYFFSSYLFVDGLFQLPYISLNLDGLMSIIHHFVGGYGIYLMAEQERGVGLGLYFAWTEVSTPLLNLSWYFYVNKIRSVISFSAFYVVFFGSRILTIPLVLKYININREIISNLCWIHYLMVYFGSYTLIFLNLMWFVMINCKVYKILVSR